MPLWLLVLALKKNAPATSDQAASNATTEIKEGSRNTELYRVGRSLHARGMRADEILAEVRTINLARCRPPLSEDEVRQIAANAATQPDAPKFEPRVDQEISGLANLSALEYDRARRSTAKRMGIRLQTLDEAVVAAREKPSLLSKRIELAPPAPVPSSDPVEGLQLFEKLRGYITRFVVISEAEAIALTLWIVFTYLLDVAEVSPRLAIQSPTKQCGKTTVLGLLAALAHRSIGASNVSPSAVFRTIDAEHPTLLIDEADSFARGNEELRGILNSGHTRATAYVIRNVKSDDDLTPRKFSTWAAIAVACIGWLPDTWVDRSVVISMKRKARFRRVERFRRRDTKVYSQAESLTREISRWAADNRERIGAVEPQMPNSLDDRACDNWEILIAMADLVGGDWPRLARDASVQLSANRERAASLGELLLADIEREFASRSSTRDRLTSNELCVALAAREGRPWPEFGQARKPISPNQLARCLAPFNVFPRSIRIGSATAKGYLQSDFRDAFSRYVPQQTDTSSLPFSEKESSSLRSGTGDLDSSAKDVRYASDEKGDYVVTDQEQQNSEVGGRA
jgi:putative DNA primase/helicase